MLHATTTDHDHTQNEACTEAKVKKEKHPLIGVHAVLISATDGTTMTIQANTRAELSKLISENSSHQLVAVFKGRKLEVATQTKFRFS